MAHLVAVLGPEVYQFKRRQVPLTIENNLTMVLQFDDAFVWTGPEVTPTIKQSDLGRFVQKLNVLSRDELTTALTVTSKQLFNALSQLVTCVGCRRCVETLYARLAEFRHPAADPLALLTNSDLTIKHDTISNPKELYKLFHLDGSKLSVVLESIPKSRRNKRCQLHSLETQKTKSLSVWLDVWEVMSKECREEVLVIECEELMVTLDEYLRKHKFCGECKSKVLRAYSLLIRDIDPDAEKGYSAALYEGLKVCPAEGHIHILCDDDFVGNLVARAESELKGSSRERHAKTLDIAQEEVLICVGVYLFDRLFRIWQKLKVEEQAWLMVFHLGVDLHKNFEVAVEKKQGISDLERTCQELIDADQMKEQRREQKRQKRKKKNQAVYDVTPSTGNNIATGPDSTAAKTDVQTNAGDDAKCKCGECAGCVAAAGRKSTMDEITVLVSACTCDQLRWYHDVGKVDGAEHGGTTHSPQYRKAQHSPKYDNAQHSPKYDDSQCSPKDHEVTNHGARCCRSEHGTEHGNQCCRSDCGYSSGHDGCGELYSSAQSSNEGSDIVCTDSGCCCNDGHECATSWQHGVSPSLCRDCVGPDGDGACRRKQTPIEDKCNAMSASRYPSSTERYRMTQSLVDMLEGSCSSGDDDDYKISEEEITRFRANQALLDSQRTELREQLRQKFNRLKESSLDTNGRLSAPGVIVERSGGFTD